jgi:diacylglycerol kinase
MQKQSFAHSLRNAAKGVLYFFGSERNAKLQLAAALGAAALGIVLHIPRIHWLALLFFTALVFVTELLNTAVEKLCDKLHPGHSKAIGQIKDMSAGAVLLAAVAALIAGGFIFLPAIFTQLKK